MNQTTIRNEIMRLLEAQSEGKTICPSDAARALDPQGFRKLMPAVREAAHSLVEQELIEVTQRGELVDVRVARGPVRLRLARH